MRKKRKEVLIVREMLNSAEEVVVDGVLAGGLLGLSLAVIIGAVLFVFIWDILQAVGYWNIFTKAGEAGWKALIPFYSTYVRYKLTWNVKMFWISALLIIANSFIPESENFVFSLVRVVLSVGSLVITVKAFHKLSLSFGHGAGFTVGLFFLEPVFALILGFGQSQYEGNADE